MKEIWSHLRKTGAQKQNLGAPDLAIFPPISACLMFFLFFEKEKILENLKNHRKITIF